MVSCWQSFAIVGYCWWSNNELQRWRLLVAINFTPVFFWMKSPATERQYFWMIDSQIKELDYTTSPAFDTVVKILHCQAAVVITDQSDTPVSLDLFDVFR